MQTNLAKSLIQTQDRNANDSWSKICFMLPMLIDEIDKLMETTQPMRLLKHHLKGVISEANNESKKHYNAVKKNMNFVDENGLRHEGEDVYFNTENAYRSIFERPTQDIIGIAELIKEAEKKGIEFKKIEVSYEPLK